MCVSYDTLSIIMGLIIVVCGFYLTSKIPKKNPKYFALTILGSIFIIMGLPQKISLMWSLGLILFITGITLQISYHIHKKKKTTQGHYILSGFAICIPIGLAIGLAINNLIIGLALGAAFGVSVGISLETIHRKRHKKLNKSQKKIHIIIRLIVITIVVLALFAYIFILNYSKEAGKLEIENTTLKFIDTIYTTGQEAQYLGVVRKQEWWESLITIDESNVILFIDPVNARIIGLDCPGFGYMTYEKFLESGGDGTGCWKS